MSASASDIENNAAITKHGEHALGKQTSRPDRKPPFLSRRSAEELKKRLASGISAKIASGSARDTSHASHSNEDIEVPLQHEEYQGNESNAKEIKSFPGTDEISLLKDSTTTDNSERSSRRVSASKTELHKSLLMALMSRRKTSVDNGEKNPQENSRKETEIDGGKPLKANENDLHKSRDSQYDVAHFTIQTQFHNAGMTEQAQLTKDGESRSEFDAIVDSVVVENDSEINANTSVLERAKHIERLLGRRNAESMLVLNGNESKDKEVGGNVNSNVNRSTIYGKRSDKEVMSIDTLMKGEKHQNKPQKANIDTNSKPETFIASNLGMRNKNIEGDENVIVRKKVPPPVTKKPSRSEIKNFKQSNLSLDNVAVAGSSGSASLNSSNHSNTKKAHDMSAKIISENNEDVLEKLEVGVGACKIVAFKTMEEFSILRIKLNQVRLELDHFKRDREKRTPLI